MTDEVLPIYPCVRAPEPIQIDGNLDEPTWSCVPAVPLRDARSGRVSGPATSIRACWSDTHLYLAFECADEDIWGTFFERDANLYDEEVVEIFLCPSGDLTRYVEIEISPHNVIFDAAIYSPDLDRRSMEADRSWNCHGMETAVAASAPIHRTAPPHRRARGPRGCWTAEIAIPFAGLGIATPLPGSEWRANFYRIDRGRRDSYLSWSRTLRRPADFHVPSRFGTLVFHEEESSPLIRDVWSSAVAWEWYRRLPWLVGCNFIPSTASNQLEMWQADTFDPATIDRELGWASDLGMNVVRVYLHDLAWQVDPVGMRQRLNQFLSVADKHGIRSILVLFDDCWNPDPQPGPQPPPLPGVHNSGWVQSPGSRVVNDSSTWGRLEAYVKDIVGSFRRDRRVLLWDLYNEPGNSDQAARSLPLLRKAFEWTRSVNPRQPLTAGIWGYLPELNRFQALCSDVITFHNYQDADALKRQIGELRRHGKPIICTEWMARPYSTVLSHLPIFRAEGVGCIQWGLVAGKTQTIYPWRSPGGGPEPAIWFHDLLRRDGSPFDPSETELLRALTARTH